MKIEIDTESELSYGWFECTTCKSQFYAGVEAHHNTGCTAQGIKNLVYHYTPKELALWESEVKEKGWLAHLPISPSCLNNGLLKAAIADGRESSSVIIQRTMDYARTITSDSETLKGIERNAKKAISI